MSAPDPHTYECDLCFKPIAVTDEEINHQSRPDLEWDEDHEKVAHASCIKDAREQAEEAIAEDRYWARRGY